MRTPLVILPLVIGSAALGGFGDTRPLPSALHASHAPGAETNRIRSHFDSVLMELRRADVSALSSSQLENRASLIGTLTAYRDRALFPHNYDFPGRAVPYFIDRKTGVLCAVAHLLESTGRRDIVDRVAASDNNVWVPELSADMELASWLSEQGISLAEAARIQVPYMSPENPSIDQGARDATYNIGSAVAFAAAGGMATWNLMGNRSGKNRLVTAVGLTIGLAAAGYGGLALNDPTADKGLGALAGVAGLASTWLATQSFRSRRTNLSRASRVANEGARVSVVPVAPVRGRSGAGVSLSVSF